MTRLFQMLTRRMLRYPEVFDDPRALAAIVADADRATVLQALDALVRMATRPAVAAACLVVRDWLIVGPGRGLVVDADAVLRAPVIGRLEHLLSSDDYQIRQQVVYTLGKIGSRSSVPALLHAFAQWYDCDPLLLPAIVMEVCWLEPVAARPLLEQLLASSFYGTRWAVLDVVTSLDSEDEVLAPQCRAAVIQLSADPHPGVRAEAQWRAAALSSAPYPPGSAARSTQPPPLTFECFTIQVGNALAHAQVQDNIRAVFEEVVAAALHRDPGGPLLPS